MSKSLSFVFPLLLGSALLRAQEPSLDELVPIQGAGLPGKIVSIDAAGKVKWTTAEGKTATSELADLRLLRLAGQDPNPVPRRGELRLRSGLRLPVSIRECEGRKFTVASPLLEGRVEFSLSHLASLRIAKLPLEADGGFARYLEEPKDEQDLIYFKTTERVLQRSVTVDGFRDDNSLAYESRDNLRTRRLDTLYGIVMAKASGLRPNPQGRPLAVAHMQGDGLVSGRLLGLDAKHCRIKIDEGIELTLRRSRLLQLEIKSDRLIYLAELAPKKVEQTPAFKTVKPWLVNRSPLGPGLHLGGEQGRVSNNGLLLVPRTRLTFDLGAGFDLFEATICIDQRSTGPAHAVFRVLHGKKVLFESKPVTRASAPQPIQVPLGDAKQITIEADFGKNYDFGDHCVFAEARVVKKRQ